MGWVKGVIRKYRRPKQESENTNLMTLRNRSVFVGKLITIGRRSGLPRTVELRFVYFDGKFYACSSNIQSKHWCQNMIKNPNVEVQADGKHFSCRVQMVTEGLVHMVKNLCTSRCYLYPILSTFGTPRKPLWA